MQKTDYNTNEVTKFSKFHVSIFQLQNSVLRKPEKSFRIFLQMLLYLIVKHHKLL